MEAGVYMYLRCVSVAVSRTYYYHSEHTTSAATAVAAAETDSIIFLREIQTPNPFHHTVTSSSSVPHFVRAIVVAPQGVVVHLDCAASLLRKPAHIQHLVDNGKLQRFNIVIAIE